MNRVVRDIAMITGDKGHSIKVVANWDHINSFCNWRKEKRSIYLWKGQSLALCW